MKIVLVSHFCTVGGVETFILSLSEAYLASGHECEVFFFQRGPLEKYLPPNCVAHFGDLTDLLKLVESRRFDIVHSDAIDWSLGVSAVRRVGAKLILTSHRAQILEQWNSSNCDAFAGCSRWIAEAQQHYTDLPMQTVQNGIDVEKFQLASNDVSSLSPIVAWVGRGSALDHKRIDKFAQVAPALKRAGLRIWLAEPTGVDQVRRVAPEAVELLQPLADFWDAVPTDAMPDFYRRVSASGGCVVSTSSWEGLPMTLLEAQAVGCPVIGADVRGVNECVDPAHGSVLYPFDLDPAQLGNLVVDTLSDKERMRWRREACSRFVQERFSLHRMAQDYLRIYKEAPYPRIKSAAATRARLRATPLFGWRNYVANRWSTGLHIYETSQRLTAEGSRSLAANAALASFATAPTLYLKPRRLAHLVKAQAKQVFFRSPDARKPVKRS